MLKLIAQKNSTFSSTMQTKKRLKVIVGHTSHVVRLVYRTV